MPIKRSSIQTRLTLEEFYMEVSEMEANSQFDIGKEMLKFIWLINELFKETLLWGVTSHRRLAIQNVDKPAGNWFVIVSNIGTTEYYFEYLLPSAKAPWKNAFVRGQANSLEEAKRYLLIAMAESGGWDGNSELKRLMQDNNLTSLD